MELEKLQQSWQKLSARLERHEMLKKEELRNFFENKTTSYMRQTMKNRYLSYIVYIFLLVLIFATDLYTKPLCWYIVAGALVLDILLAIPMYRLLRRIARFEENIVEQERMILNYRKLFIRNSILMACFIASIFVAIIIINITNKPLEVSNYWWLWLGISTVISFIIGMVKTTQEKEQIDEIHQRLTMLKEWESEDEIQNSKFKIQN